MRKAALCIIRADELQEELRLTNSSNNLLGRMLSYKDSVLYENGIIIMDNQSIIKATQTKLDVAEWQNQALKKRFNNLRFNDRMKVGIFSVIVAGLVYAYIEKK